MVTYQLNCEHSKDSCKGAKAQKEEFRNLRIQCRSLRGDNRGNGVSPNLRALCAPLFKLADVLCSLRLGDFA
jgi:hypothetical protein